jgi:hypothetical protein
MWHSNVDAFNKDPMGDAKDDDDFIVEIWDVNIFSFAKEKNG